MGWVAGAIVGVALLIAGAAKLTSRQWPDQADLLGVPRGAVKAIPVLELGIGLALVAGVSYAGVAAIVLLGAFTVFLVVALAGSGGAVCVLRLVVHAAGDLVVGRAQRRVDRAGGDQPDVTFKVLRMNASTSASSRHESYRPDFPPWPTPISVFRTSGRSPVPIARSRATHFAGSW